MGHLVKVWTKYPGHKPVCERAVLPCIGSAIQIYNDYMKKHSPAKMIPKEAIITPVSTSSTVSPQKVAAQPAAPTVAKWEGILEKKPSTREKSPKPHERDTTLKEEFPQLQKILPDSSRVIGNKSGPPHCVYSVSEGKSVSLGEDTESSRNQSSDIPRIGAESFPSHLMDTEGILNERFRLSLELKNGSMCLTGRSKEKLNYQADARVKRARGLQQGQLFPSQHEPQQRTWKGICPTRVGYRRGS